MDTKRSSRPQKDVGQHSNRADFGDENAKSHQNKSIPRQSDKKSDSVNAKKTESSSARTPQATADQMRIPQLFQIAGSSDRILQEQIDKVRDCTGCTPDEAFVALHDTGNDIEAAVNLVLEGGANKNEWEEAGKKGKKQKPKVKPDDSNEQDLPVGMSNRSARGRPAQRGTSSRGGKSSAPSAPRAVGLCDADEAGLNGSRNTTSARDHQHSPNNAEPRSRGAPDATKGRSDQEHPWGDDVDDDWKETIRETKVFERSAATVPSVSNVFSPVTPIVQQLVQQTSTGSGPSFSAILQKPAASGWSGSPSGTTPASQDPGWRAGSALSSSQKPQTQPPTHLDSSLVATQGFGSSHGLPFPSSHESKIDTPSATLGTAFSNLTFNNRTANVESSSQVPPATQSFNRNFSNQTNSTDFGSNSRSKNDQISNTARSSVNPVVNDPGKPPAPLQNNSASSFVLASQSQTFSNSQQDGPLTYPSRNVVAATGGLQPVNIPPNPKSPSNTNENIGSHIQTPIAGQISFGSSNVQQPPTDSRFTSNTSAIGVPKLPVVSQPVHKLETPVYSNQRLSGVIQNQGTMQTVTQPVQQFQPPLQQSSPTGKTVHSGTSAPTSFTNYGQVSTDTAARNTFSGYQIVQPNQNAKDLGSSGQQQPLMQSSNQNTGSFSPQKSQSTTTPVFSSSKPIPSTTMAPKSAYGNQTSNSSQNVNQQHYHQQQQQQPMYNQQGVLPMYSPAVFSTLDAMSDPRVMQQGMNLDYAYGANALSGRDPTGGIGYSTVDHNKYRNEPGVGGQQVPISQQAAFVQPHMSAYPGYLGYASPVAGGYQQYGQPQMFQNIPSQYSKPTGALQSSFQPNYSDLSGLADISKTAYAVSGMRGTSNDPYATSSGLLGAGSDLQSSYYGNKNASKFDKPAQGFGLPMANQQSGYGNQYGFPIMQQQQPLHSMAQMQQGSAISNQNATNNKQNKPGQYYGWPHQ